MQIQPLMGPGVASYEQPTEAATEMDLEAKYQQHLQLLDEQEKYAPIQSTGVVSSFTGGVGAGIDQTQALLGGAVGLAGSAAKNLTGGMIGSDMEAWGQETYRENMKQAQRYVPVEGAATFAEADSVSDYANWAAHTAGELLPTMATMLAGGGVGGAIGKQLLGNTLKVTAAKSVAETLGKKGLLSATEKGVLADAVKIAGRPERWGQTLGVGLGSTALESGGIYGRQVTGENFDEQNDPEVGNALLYGGIAGALDSIVPAYLLNKLGTGKALSAALTKGDDAKQSLLAGALKEITKTAPIEGVTEVLQGVLERAAQQDSEGRLDTPEGLEKVFDSKQAIEEFAAGMLGGTLFGGPAGAMAANQQNKQQALLGERESKVAALRERIRVEAERARQVEELKARQAPWVALAEQARQQTTQDQAVGRLRQIKMKLAELQGTSPDTVDIYRKDAKGGKQAQALMAEAQTISQTLMGEAKGPSAEQRQETIQTTPLARQQEIDSLFPMQPDEKQRLMQSRAEQGIQARELPVEEVSAEPPYMVEDLGTPEEITAPPLTGQERIDETAREVQKGIQLTLMDKARQQAQEAEKETQLGLMETENEAQLRRIEQENEAQRKELEQEIPPRVTPESLPANNLLATPEMAKLRRKLEFEQRPSVEEDASAGEQMASTPPSPARTRLAEELGERHVRRAEESGFLKVIPDEEWEQQGFNPSAHGMFVSKGNNGQARIYVKASAADPVSVVLHESEHADMKTVLGESYGGIQRQFDRALKAGDERALSAQQRVNASLKIWREGQVRRGKTPSAAQEQAIIQSERLAYFIEEAQVREGEKPTGLLGRMLNSVRAWWRTSELGKSWAANGMGNLSDGVTLALAKRAFKVGALKAEMLEGAGAEKAGEQSEQPSFAGKSAIPAKTQDVDNEKQIVTFGDTQQNGEMASIENSPRAIAQAAKPEFKEWFGDSAVVTAEGKPKMVFRGDRNFQGTYLRMPTDGLINQQLGVHFAADPRQTDAFTIGTYARDSTWASDDNTVPGEQRMWDGTSYPIRAKPGGSTMAGWIASDKIYTIPNYGMSDQANISTEAVGWLLRKEPEIFVQYVMQTRNVTEEQARAAWNILSNGNPIETGALKVPVTYIEETGGDGFKAFASNYISDGAFPNIKGTPWATYVANTFRQHLLDSGYKVIQYENTSGNEVGPGIDPTAYIVLDPLAFKAYTNKGTFGKDTDNVLASVPKTPGFETWRQKAPVIRADNTQEYAGGGSPAIFEMFHGTTHGEIRKFKMEGGNTINSLGQGSYFTTSREDASSNYAGEGPDLSHRIDREMDQIRDSFWEESDMATWVLEDYFQAHQIEEDVTDDNLEDLRQQYGDKAIREVAAKAVKGETDGLIMPVWVKLLKPFDMGPNGLELGYEYNPETDQEEGNAIDLLKALREVGYEWGEDVSSLEQYLMEDGMDKITAEDFWKEGKRELAIYSDPDGNEASYGQFLQEVVRRAGFDGIIQDADAEYGTGRLYGSPMKGVTPGTLHIIPFSQNQIKSSLGNSGNYSLQDDDITASVPKEGFLNAPARSPFYNRVPANLLADLDFAGIIEWQLDLGDKGFLLEQLNETLPHLDKVNDKDLIANFKEAIRRLNAFDDTAPLPHETNFITVDGKQRPVYDSTGAIIESGNKKKIENFWRWFGDSKVVNSNGLPAVMFHATGGQFDVFSPDASSISDVGFHFGTIDQAEKAGRIRYQFQVMPMYLQIETPLTIRDVFGGFTDNPGVAVAKEVFQRGIISVEKLTEIEKLPRKESQKVITQAILNAGYDGLRYKNTVEGPGYSWVALKPEQIKSVIANSGEYDKENPSFLASVPKAQTYTPEFKNWFGDWEADPKNASKIVDEAGRPLVVYHGTKRNFNEFIAAYPDGLVFFTTNNKFAEKWPVGNGGLRTGPKGTEEEARRISARENQLYKEIMQPDYDFKTKEGQAAYDADRAKLKERITQETGFPSSWSFESEAGIQVIPVYLDIKKPFDPSKQWAEMEPFLRDRLGDEIINKGYHKKGNWLVYEDKAVIDELKRRGYDGIWLNEETNGPQETIATFYPERQIKSAIGNSGRFDLADSDFTASVFSGATVGPLSAEIQNRKSLWRRSVDYIKRGWAPAGHLSTYAPGAHAEIISRDSAQNMEDAMGERFVHDLERAIEEDTGQSYTKLADADWDKINEALRGDAAAFNALSANVQPVVGGMRIYLDSFSKQYAGVLQTIVDEMGGGVAQLTQEVAALRARISGMPRGQDRTDLMAEARAKQSELNQLTARMGGKQQLITIIQGNLGKWLNRSYRVFDDKNWYKNVEEGVLERAQQYIVDSQGVTPEAANTQIRRLLKDMTAFDSIEDWIREGKVGALDLRTLLHRNDTIAQPILDLLGEYRDPRVNFAKSAAKVTRLVFNTQLQLRLRDIGLQTGWLSNDKKGALPPGMDKTITGGKNYEYLDGLITYHEVAQGLHDILGHQPWPPWLENIVQVTSFVKRQKTLMSPLPTTFRNYITSLMGMVANGDYSWKGIKYGADAAREYIFNKDLGNKRQHLDHITILGVSYDTPFTGELDALLKDTKLEDSLLKEGAPGQKNSIGLAIYRGWEKFNKVMTRGYQFGDDFVKIAAFHGKYANLNRLIGERVRAEYQGQSADSTWQNPTIGSISLQQGEDGSWSFRDQYGHNIVEEQTSWGTEQEARQEVGEVLGKWHVEKMTAERIRNTYMTYSMVGRTPRFLRKFPLTGTFVSFPVEVLRTVSNMARYIGRDMKDPELRPMAIRQSLGMLVAATAAYGAEEWARRAIGLTKEELKAQKEGLAPWDTFSTMVPIGRDEKGRPQFINTGYIDLYSMLHILPNALNSNMPKGEALEKAAWQLAAPFIGWDITAGKVKEVLLNKTESGRMIWDPVRDSPTDQGLKITEHLLRGIASTTLLKGEKIFQAMAGVRTPDGEKLDTQEEILGLFGAKPVTLDPARIINYGLLEFQGQKRAVTSALSRAIADTRDTDLGMEYLRAKSARDKAYATMGRKVAAAKAMGWSGEQVFTMLRRLKVDRKDANALVRGEVPKWRVTNEAFKSAVQRAKSLGDEERVQEVKERRRELLDRLLEG